MMDIDTQRQRLLALAHDLEDRQAQLARHGRDGVPADFAEQATARENDEVVVSLERQVEAELAQVRAALARIEQGRYGHCTQCGAAIAAARLAALPYAATCTACA